MNKTRVDDMLIEMITPKVKEIEEKFSKGGNLTQEDINTLLLKSQYNHINHLDERLDEVVKDNAQLRLDFEVRMSSLENKMESRMSTLENKMDSRMSTLENKMESRMGSLENKFATLETKFAGLETKFARLETKVEQGYVKMQETIISTTRWYIGGAGIILIALKALDIFIKT